MESRSNVTSCGKQGKGDEEILRALSALITKVCVISLNFYDQIILTRHSQFFFPGTVNISVSLSSSS